MSTLEPKDIYLHNLFLTISDPDVYQVGITEDILEDTRRNTKKYLKLNYFFHLANKKLKNHLKIIKKM